MAQKVQDYETLILLIAHKLLFTLTESLSTQSKFAGGQEEVMQRVDDMKINDSLW